MAEPMIWQRHRTTDGWTWYSCDEYTIQRFSRSGFWALYRNGERIGTLPTLKAAKAKAAALR